MCGGWYDRTGGKGDFRLSFGIHDRCRGHLDSDSAFLGLRLYRAIAPLLQRKVEGKSDCDEGVELESPGDAAGFVQIYRAKPVVSLIFMFIYLSMLNFIEYAYLLSMQTPRLRYPAKMVQRM